MILINYFRSGWVSARSIYLGGFLIERAVVGWFFAKINQSISKQSKSECLIPRNRHHEMPRWQKSFDHSWDKKKKTNTVLKATTKQKAKNNTSFFTFRYWTKFCILNGHGRQLWKVVVKLFHAFSRIGPNKFDVHYFSQLPIEEIVDDIKNIRIQTWD
jgi:hypothetical protein